jgi:hypothetical protein
VGIGTFTPQRQLHVSTVNGIPYNNACNNIINPPPPDPPAGIRLENILWHANNSSAWDIIPQLKNSSNPYNTRLDIISAIYPFNITTPVMTLLDVGFVGIGTVSPQYQLDVIGTIRATDEIKICSYGTCDFVFDKNYYLMPIDSLNIFIKQNSHLPGIASAKQMEAEGSISLGKMDTQLLQKIEELTLYIIEQDKRIKELEKKLNAK